MKESRGKQEIKYLSEADKKETKVVEKKKKSYIIVTDISKKAKARV